MTLTAKEKCLLAGHEGVYMHFAILASHGFQIVLAGMMKSRIQINLFTLLSVPVVPELLTRIKSFC
jgi:hypothetical protein